MSKDHYAIHEKVRKQLEKYDDDVRSIIENGLEYSIRNNSQFVSSRLRRDIDQIVKGRKK